MSEIKPTAWLCKDYPPFLPKGQWAWRLTMEEPINGLGDALIKLSEHQAEIDHLRDELDTYKSLVSGIVDNRHKCFIPTDDPSSPTFNWDDRANSAIGASE